MSHPHRLLASSLAAAICGLGVTAPAIAATIGINGTILTATATAGDDVLVGSFSGTDLLLSGVPFTIVTPGCSPGGPATVLCALSGFDEVRIVMGDGDDVVNFGSIPSTGPLGSPAIRFIILGGNGDDVLIGTAGDELSYGGAGDDVILGGGGLLSCADGGPGDNVLIETFCGGPPEPDFPPARPEPAPGPDVVPLLLSGTAATAVARRQRRSASR